jgi:hypothetical protein
VKKIFSALLIMILMFLLVACDTNSDRYQSAMHLITGGTTVENDNDTPVVIVPDEGDDDPVEDEEPEPRWPADVPKVEEFVKKYRFLETDGDFKARYIVTSEQLQVWEAALTTAGFIGEPRINKGLSLTYTTSNNNGNLNLFITISAIDTKWPEDFSEFPEFPATGKIVIFETYEEHGAKVLHIRVENESKQTIEVYLQALKRAGFNNLGYGYYTKFINEVTYEFDGDQATMWDGTTADLYWRIYYV